MRRTACLTIAAGLALGGGLTACGAGSDTAAPAVSARATPVSPLHVVQAAYTRTAEAGSLQFALDGTFGSTG